MKIILSFFLLVYSSLGLLEAQTDSATKSAPNGFSAMMQSMKDEPIELVSPGAGFIPMENGRGYLNPEIDAKFTFLPLPASFEKMTKDFEKQKDRQRPGTEVLEMGPKTVASWEGLLLKTQVTPPSDSDYEPFINLMYVVPLEKGAKSLAIVAAFPARDSQELEPRIWKAIGDSKVK